ncbi:MAG: hypothetical protein OXF09_01490 [Hyphomicrobiales bacterium]|nr:hypothetical protein [Hyphomicrobiales bacterium]
MKGQGKLIDTRKLAERLRGRSVDVINRRVLISHLSGSEQEVDFSKPANCGGFGRVRNFHLCTPSGWPSNPLPIAPACKAIGIQPIPDTIPAQVFQNAACAWRCWYCFVPYNLLAANPKHSKWFTSKELVTLYAQEQNRPLIIDLSGGSPDLVPEWVLWMMDALTDASLHKSTFLWSDDNLSTTCLFDHLNSRDLNRLVQYQNYARVCCFKGYDARSFTFNTRAMPKDYDCQFQIMSKLLNLGLDIYGYVTLTSPYTDRVKEGVCDFIDRLQALDSNLPLRVIPLQIRIFTPVKERLCPERKRSLDVQEEAISVWNSEIASRFDIALRSANITDVPLNAGKK